MYLLTQPNEWSCLPTAAAMVTNLSVHLHIIPAIGHDGSELIEGKERKSFHPEEIITALFKLDWHVQTFLKEFRFTPPGCSIELHYDFSHVVKAAMSEYNGILVGNYIGQDQHPHAVAWDRSKIYDPSGRICSLDLFDYECFYAVSRKLT